MHTQMSPKISNIAISGSGRPYHKIIMHMSVLLMLILCVNHASTIVIYHRKPNILPWCLLFILAAWLCKQVCCPDRIGSALLFIISCFLATQSSDVLSTQTLYSLTLSIIISNREPICIKQKKITSTNQCVPTVTIMKPYIT